MDGKSMLFGGPSACASNKDENDKDISWQRSSRRILDKAPLIRDPRSLDPNLLQNKIMFLNIFWFFFFLGGKEGSEGSPESTALL